MPFSHVQESGQYTLLFCAGFSLSFKGQNFGLKAKIVIASDLAVRRGTIYLKPAVDLFSRVVLMLILVTL
ncbi:MAG: hypothetical protein IPG53_15660 [Ignavibacteriales bacterium]|nr:hypothetical protein [Ignavibacteriales bacterium]